MPKPTIRILCFGASLVEGFTQGGLRYTPYSTTMAQILQEELPGLEVVVDVDGKSAQTVVLHYGGRLERRFESEFFIT